MAAETVTDSNVNPWGLYVRELEFVAGYTRTIDSAEDLLLDTLGQPGRIIRWLPRQLDHGSFDPAQLEEVRKTLLKAGYGEKAIEGYLGRELEFFWRPSDHSRITVDRANSNATRIGPPWVVGSRTRLELVDGKLTPVEDHWPIFLTGLAPVTLKAKLVRLHHDDVVALLRQPVKFHKPLATETADVHSLLHSLLPARGDGDGQGRRRHRPQIRNGIRQAAAQAYAAILLVRQHGFTVAEAAQFTRSNSTAIAAMAVLNDNGDSDLLNAVVTDEVPFLPTAARLKPLVKARKAFSALSKLDRIEFARREGPEKLFNEIIVPASAPVTELVV